MNTEMKIFEAKLKYTQELQAKARKYDELKEAVDKIKDEIKGRIDAGSTLEMFGMTIAKCIIDKHTEGLI